MSATRCTSGDLDTWAANARAALDRAEARAKEVKLAMRDAGEWLEKILRKVRGGPRWKSILKRHGIGLRMAYYCRAVYERWDEVSKFPADLSTRRICQALVKNPRVKEFDPYELLRSQAFKAFLKAACKEWTEKEIRYLKANLGQNPELDQAVMDAMTETSIYVRGDTKTRTAKALRRECERASQMLRLRLSAQREALEAFTPNDLLESDFS